MRVKMDDRSVAHETVLEQLQTFGLSTYAARTFVALVSLGHGTASEVSNTVSVPRTRVYDAVDELEQRGLVTVKENSPQQFWPISPETTGAKFEREYIQHADVLRDALDSLESNAAPTEQRGVWTVDGHEAISERIVQLLRTADEEVVFASADSLLDPTVIQSLGEAQNDGITIKLGEMGAPTKSDISSVLTDTTRDISLWEFENRPPGRLVIVDSERTLVSTVVPDEHDGARSSQDSVERAIWGRGPDNNVISVLRVLFGQSAV